MGRRHVLRGKSPAAPIARERKRVVFEAADPESLNNE
jgi:hypothetical protein